MTETPSEYDLLLAAVPAPLAAAWLVSLFSTVGTAAALGIGSLVAFLPLIYTLFLSPPV